MTDEIGIRRRKAISGIDVDHLHEKAQGVRDETRRKHEKWNGQDGDRQQREDSRPVQRGPPGIDPNRRPTPPYAALFPRSRRGINRGKQRTDHTDASAAHDVDFYAGFMQRAQHAGMIGARGPIAAEQDGSPQVW
jgi:hypothetical protein